MSISTRPAASRLRDLGAAGHRQRLLRPAEAALAVGHHRQRAPGRRTIRRAARSSASASAYRPVQVGGEPGGLPDRRRPGRPGPGPRPRARRRPRGPRRAAGRPSPGAGDGVGVHGWPASSARPAPRGPARAGDVVRQRPARPGAGRVGRRCAAGGSGAGPSGRRRLLAPAAGPPAARRRACRRRRPPDRRCGSCRAGPRGLPARPAGRRGRRTGRRSGRRARCTGTPSVVASAVLVGHA